MSSTNDGRSLEDLLTWREASTAPDAIAAALAAAAGTPPADAARTLLATSDQIVVTGAGSSYYLALAVAAAGRAATGRPFSAAPLSELLLRPGGTLGSGPPERRPVVVISRSGSTSEAVAVTEAMQRRGHPTIAVTCREASPLAGLADVTLVSPAGDEAAIVMTRSFASMLALLLRVVVDLAGDERGARDLDRAVAAWADVAAAVEVGRELGLTRWSRIVILGGGAAYGIASEWGLKLLETSQVPTSAYEPLEFRHGPISVCEPGVLVVGLVGGDAATEEARVLDESRALGADTWLLTDDPAAAARDAGRVSVIAPGVGSLARLPLLLTPGHALALSVALVRGRDPDAPRHLDQVVILSP